MPKQTTDIVEAASRAFHFNFDLLFPEWIVIRSDFLKSYAVTTLETFHRCSPTHDPANWQIAINLSSIDLLALMGQVPKKHTEPDTCTVALPVIDPQDPGPLPESDS